MRWWQWRQQWIDFVPKGHTFPFGGFGAFIGLLLQSSFCAECFLCYVVGVSFVILILLVNVVDYRVFQGSQQNATVMSSFNQFVTTSLSGGENDWLVAFKDAVYTSSAVAATSILLNVVWMLVVYKRRVRNCFPVQCTCSACMDVCLFFYRKGGVVYTHKQIMLLRQGDPMPEIRGAKAFTQVRYIAMQAWCVPQFFLRPTLGMSRLLADRHLSLLPASLCHL